MPGSYYDDLLSGANGKCALPSDNCIRPTWNRYGQGPHCEEWWPGFPPSHCWRAFCWHETNSQSLAKERSRKFRFAFNWRESRQWKWAEPMRESGKEPLDLPPRRPLPRLRSIMAMLPLTGASATTSSQWEWRETQLTAKTIPLRLEHPWKLSLRRVSTRPSSTLISPHRTWAVSDFGRM